MELKVPATIEAKTESHVQTVFEKTALDPQKYARPYIDEMLLRVERDRVETIAAGEGAPVEVYCTFRADAFWKEIHLNRDDPVNVVGQPDEVFLAFQTDKIPMALTFETSRAQNKDVKCDELPLPVGSHSSRELADLDGTHPVELRERFSANDLLKDPETGLEAYLMASPMTKTIEQLTTALTRSGSQTVPLGDEFTVQVGQDRTSCFGRIYENEPLRRVLAVLDDESEVQFQFIKSSGELVVVEHGIGFTSRYVLDPEKSS